MNVAFEDALLLSRLLDDTESVSEALECFSRERVAEMEAMHELGMLCYRHLQSPYPQWRVRVQQRWGRYPSVYSMINFEQPDRLSFREALHEARRQNHAWWRLGRLV